MDLRLDKLDKLFFIGIAGAGMSALAQYLVGIGKKVGGSDRYFKIGEPNETKEKLEAEGIVCFGQDGSGIDASIDVVIVSTAIEDTVPEVAKAKKLGIPIIKRSELLALVAESKKTIAVAGTSGKSTTAAMLYHILDFAGTSPGIISGAGLTSLIKKNKIGNAAVGKGDFLVIEADESDGSIVQYKPTIGLLLNVDKDHQEMEELEMLFAKFKENTKEKFVVNRDNVHSKSLSENIKNDFSQSDGQAGFYASDFMQNGFAIGFRVNGVAFELNTIGRHNMENALAAAAVAAQLGVGLETSSKALKSYEGIYRRAQIIGEKNGVLVVDDYAHNPVKCAAAIKACQPISKKVVAWFQPHGYGPTKFLRNDFVDEFEKALRPEDEVWMSEIFYAGGTAVKDISANDLIKDLQKRNKNAYFVEDRKNLINELRPHLEAGAILLLMGARDPSLELFAKQIFEEL